MGDQHHYPFKHSEDFLLWKNNSSVKLHHRCADLPNEIPGVFYGITGISC